MKKETTSMSVPQLVTIGFIFVGVSLAWLILGGTVSERYARSSVKTKHSVTGHWGPSHSQSHPLVGYRPDPAIDSQQILPPSSGRVDVNLAFEPKRKGLTSGRTFVAQFDATYQITNSTSVERDIYISFPLPSEETSYTDFSLAINGDQDADLMPEGGRIKKSVTLAAGETVPLNISYTSRGMDFWEYRLGNAERIRNFILHMETNFEDIDFLANSSSPTSRVQTDDGGWKLAWDYPDVIRPQDIGMDMPTLKDPAPIAAKISYFAPIPLLFFFAILIIFGMLKGIILHPMHFVFLAGCFFAFHLLFAYMVDHLPLHVSFVIASLVSLGLVGSYVRALGGKPLMRIALPAQLAYLVLFSYSFLFNGVTGLTLAVGSIATLALVMHATAKVDWDAVFASGKKKLKPMVQQNREQETT
ncbi:MAG: inner membrane CreD family protein [Akkermansiaceae bacterium]